MGCLGQLVMGKSLVTGFLIGLYALDQHEFSVLQIT